MLLCNTFASVLQKALRTGTSTRLDERVFAMCEFKSQPLHQIMRMVHPDLYRIDNMTEQVTQNIWTEWCRRVGLSLTAGVFPLGGAAPEWLCDPSAAFTAAHGREAH